MRSQSTPRGQVIFCDDLRQEIGAKVSFVGVYSEQILFPPNTIFPAFVPKICAAIFWHEPMDGHASRLAFRIHFCNLDAGPEDFSGPLLAEMTYDTATLFSQFAPPGNSESLKMTRQLLSLFALSPCTIPHPGKLRVTVERDDVIWAISAMPISVQDSEATAS
jgi:hypothetical protein